MKSSCLVGKKNIYLIIPPKFKRFFETRRKVKVRPRHMLLSSVANGQLGTLYYRGKERFLLP